MGEVTHISWCEHTHNHWIGCSKVSPACDGCYAEAMMDKRYHRVEWGKPGHGAGTRSLTSVENRRKPHQWNKKAMGAGTRPFVFCSSLADVFDNQVPRDWREDLFQLIRDTPHLVWLLLTKRPQNIVYMSLAAHGLPSNAAIGATVEDQQRAFLNVPHLIDAKKELSPLFAFLSCEPLLSGLNLTPYLYRGGLDWVIGGHETDQGDHKARITEIAWDRALRDQCAVAGIPYHHKQNGEWLAWQQTMADGSENYLSFGKSPVRFQHGNDGEIYSKVGKRRSGRLLDGQLHDARPAVVSL